MTIVQHYAPCISFELPEPNSLCRCIDGYLKKIDADREGMQVRKLLVLNFGNLRNLQDSIAF